jgi:hypothetical protein
MFMQLTLMPIADPLLAHQQDEAVRLRDFLGERP